MPDPQGGLEFLTHATTLSAPFFKARPASLPQHLPSVTMMAVVILPSSIPLNASRGFSQALVPYLESLIASYSGDNSGDRIEALNRATIVNKGELAPKHQWLQERVDAWRASTTKPTTSSHGNLKAKRVLMFGSGMVAGPAVDKLAERSDVRLVIGGLFIFSVLYHAFLNFRSQLATPAWRWRSFVAIITMYSTVKLIWANMPMSRGL